MTLLRAVSTVPELEEAIELSLDARANRQESAVGHECLGISPNQTFSSGPSGRLGALN